MWLTLRPTADQVKKFSIRSPLLGVDLERFCEPRALSDAPRTSFLSTNSEVFHEICRFCGRVAQRWASPCAATLIWREIGSPCAKNWGLLGHSGCPRGGRRVAPCTNGVALIHIVFYFSTSPSYWGGVNGRSASRVDQSGGPEHGKKEAKEGRCEA